MQSPDGRLRKILYLESCDGLAEHRICVRRSSQVIPYAHANLNFAECRHVPHYSQMHDESLPNEILSELIYSCFSHDRDHPGSSKKATRALGAAKSEK